MDSGKQDLAPGEVPATYNFTFDPLVSSFTVSPQTYISTNPRPDNLLGKVSHLGVGALIFDQPIPVSNPTSLSYEQSTAEPRILLVQRAAANSVANRWEVPGGMVEQTDTSVLHGVVREVFEESGLVVQRIGPEIGNGEVWGSPSGNVVLKLTFMVDVTVSGKVAGEVKLVPREHQDYAWATEAEIRKEWCDGRGLEFTFVEQKQAILEGFEMRKSMMRME